MMNALQTWIVMAQSLILDPVSSCRPLHIAGFDIRVLLSGNDAQAVEVFLSTGKGGTGPAPHSHPWEETFFVLRGSIVFGIGTHENSVGPGTLVHVSGGERHWYRFGEDEGEFLSFTSGKAAAAMYRELAGLKSNATKTEYRSVAIRHGQESR